MSEMHELTINKVGKTKKFVKANFPSEETFKEKIIYIKVRNTNQELIFYCDDYGSMYQICLKYGITIRTLPRFLATLYECTSNITRTKFSNDYHFVIDYIPGSEPVTQPLITLPTGI